MHQRKAMIMAAGLGTRLYPITKDRPKALVEYKGKTLLQITIERLLKYGFKDIIINVHHFPEMILSFLEDNDNFGAEITISDETNELLETGGGLKKASWYFDSGAFLVHNVDVITGLNLDELYNCHNTGNNIATLAVMKRDTTRPLLLNEKNKLCGWRNIITGDEIIMKQEDTLTSFGFSGIYVLSPEIFNFMIETGIFSIMKVLLRLAPDHNIGAFHHSGYWRDMGRKGKLY